jgi:hypothetical protein
MNYRLDAVDLQHLRSAAARLANGAPLGPEGQRDIAQVIILICDKAESEGQP